MKSIILWCAAALAAVIATGCLATETGLQPSSVTMSGDTHQVSLAYAVEMTWQRAVRSKEINGYIRQVRAELAQAEKAWAAPLSLELSYRDDRWQTNVGDKEYEVSLSWPLWLPGQRTAHIEVSETEQQLAEMAVTAGRLYFAGIVLQQAWALNLVQVEVRFAEAQRDLLMVLSEDVQRRVVAGELAQADVLLAKAELLSATSSLMTAQQNMRQQQLQWQTLTGLTHWPGLLTQDGVALLKNDSVLAKHDILPAALAGHPEIQLAGLQLQLAEKRLELTGKTRSSAPELLLSLRQESTAFENASVRSVGIGVRVPFGDAAAKRTRQAEALTELDMAQLNLQRLQEQLNAGFTVARANVQQHKQRLMVETERARLLQQYLVLAERSFQSGESALPELLRHRLAAVAAETSVIRQQAALGLAYAQLQQASGILLP